SEPPSSAPWPVSGGSPAAPWSWPPPTTTRSTPTAPTSLGLSHSPSPQRPSPPAPNTPATPTPSRGRDRGTRESVAGACLALLRATPSPKTRSALRAQGRTLHEKSHMPKYVRFVHAFSSCRAPADGVRNRLGRSRSRHGGRAARNGGATLRRRDPRGCGACERDVRGAGGDARSHGRSRAWGVAPHGA